MATVIATTAHAIPDRSPIQLQVGDLVEIEKRDTEWPAFDFVTTRTGQGWVPVRNLSAPEGHALCRIPYDTTELPTSVGDTLEVLEEDFLGGWLWCRSQAGKEGWVPMNTVEPVEE